MTTTDDFPTTDVNGVPWSDYLRVVEFVDREPQPRDRAPVHVAGTVLFDGVAAQARIRRNDFATVDVSGEAGTVLTLQVHRDDVTIGGTDEDGTYRPHMLAERLVMTPTEPGWEWTAADDTDPDNPWMTVSIYVAEVHVR